MKDFASETMGMLVAVAMVGLWGYGVVTSFSANIWKGVAAVLIPPLGAAFGLMHLL